MVGCSWVSPQNKHNKKETLSVERPIGAILPESYAMYRSKIIENLDYQIELDLTKPKHYTGLAKIKFSLKEAQGITVDFTGGEIDEVKINGFSKPQEYNQYFLVFKKQDLSVGENLIEIKYRHSFATEQGLIRYVDPLDKKVYIYSEVSGYGVNQIWPCFDQTDLFSTIELIVKTPKDWQVISSSPKSTADYAGGFFYWQFPRFGKLNMRGLPLAAGFYQSWQKNINTQNHELTLRVWSRPSIAKKIPWEDLFLATKNGFVFFEKEFDKAYALTKYDQVLIPSVEKLSKKNYFGAAFLAEKEILLDSKSSHHFSSINLEVLKNISGWWLGQNITAQTLEDEWIVKSFMKYSSVEASQRGTLYAKSDFFLLREKFKSASLDVASVFVWRWLRTHTSGFLFNERKLLNQFSQKSISTDNFIKFWKQNTSPQVELREMLSDINFKDNRLQVDYECTSQKTSHFSLKADQFHKSPFLKNLKVSVFRLDGPRIVEMKTARVDVDSEIKKIPLLEGIDCSQIAFVLLDPQNETFVKWRLDKFSLETLAFRIKDIEDEKIKFYAILLLQQAVHDKVISINQYLDIIQKNKLASESIEIQNLLHDFKIESI